MYSKLPRGLRGEERRERHRTMSIPRDTRVLHISPSRWNRYSEGRRKFELRLAELREERARNLMPRTVSDESLRKERDNEPRH